MGKTGLKTATGFLQNPNKDLNFILSKIKKLQQLQEQLKLYLEPDIQPLCFANLENNKLIFITASSAIATCLRLQTTDLLKKFKENSLLANIQHIECKVSPKLAATSSTQRPSHKVKRLSAETAKMVQTIAETLDDPLKKIMQRIAKRQDHQN